jgi:predicted RNA binding protein YcfA (HicA-like mRNA interferase family)
MLLKAGFVWLRSKGSHRIYAKGGRRIVVPFHSGATCIRRLSDGSSKASRKPRFR